MENESCSCCSLDAIFESNCGQIKACPKHYFYYKIQGYELKRIKIPINSESRQILLSFITKLKQECIYWLDNLLIENWKNEDKNYEEELSWFNEMHNYCSRIILFFNANEFVQMKLILSPLEYFLTQPKEKALKYIEEHWNRANLLEFRKTVKLHLCDFNYFKFKDQKYIHGWVYKYSYNKPRLSNFCSIIFFDFIKISEYEMAYELCQNLKSYLELYDHSSIQKIKNIIDLFGNIFTKILEKESYFQLYEQWRQIADNESQTLVTNKIKTLATNALQKNANNALQASVPNALSKLLEPSLIKKPTGYSSNNLEFFLCFILDRVLSMMFIDNNVSEYCYKILCEVEYYSQYYSKNTANKINQELGLFYYGSKNYSKSIVCFKNSINYHTERLQGDKWENIVGIWENTIEYLIEAYLCLARAYSALNKNEEIKEILKIIEIGLVKDKFFYCATIAEIYYLLNDFDKAFETIWKCIKMSKQKEFINFYKLSNLWLYLADIHTWKGDFEKAHQSLCNAKSLLSILPKADPNEQEMYKAFGIFYLNRQWYDEALLYFGFINNRWSNHELLFAKLSMGIVYFWMLSVEEAWEFLIEAKLFMHFFTESYKI
ncbi:unnamed protein product [Blepharisma stoltei]|uniref:Tetratricopeptide repeat protein n=1 Tax=Blepharisma stoltei TaxID=1481888 RepID=A0AAU9JEX6_9CILI|nr:unnamed protein product [Blepharisma stoltei]